MSHFENKPKNKVLATPRSRQNYGGVRRIACVFGWHLVNPKGKPEDNQPASAPQTPT
ncbi:hypothetical protein HMPREF0580_0787 [Mobiluncus mulieris ATCC 35239]|uniref:Uncharacterized protein n=1 Tax=Mobiluncus mulieris ATCC 35239 TaxID=871571 RepID=E0QPH2_9ACTO|nr:hypothetical protein HMPREF0580_0787 [Mobiluncus mulieris ATCC 35239]